MGFFSARTPLASILQKSLALASAGIEKQIGTGQAIIIEGNTSQKALVTIEKEKRQFFNFNGEGKNTPRIVIVGAGLAGLTSAYRLKQDGVISTIYEATNRVGGRCWTRRGYFKEDQMIERGGELIDTGHKEIQGAGKRAWFRIR